MGKIVTLKWLGAKLKNGKGAAMKESGPLYPKTTSDAVQVPGIGKLTAHVHPRIVVSEKQLEDMIKNGGPFQDGYDYIAYRGSGKDPYPVISFGASATNDWEELDTSGFTTYALVDHGQIVVDTTDSEPYAWVVSPKPLKFLQASLQCDFNATENGGSYYYCSDELTAGENNYLVVVDEAS